MFIPSTFKFFFSSRRRHTRSYGDWSSDVCSSDLHPRHLQAQGDRADERRVRLHRERSEERRVGKECRSRGTPDYLKKKRLLLPSLLIMLIPSTFKRTVSSWKAMNLRKTLLLYSSV